MTLLAEPVGLRNDCGLVSSFVKETIERHVADLEGTPTPALVEGICGELKSPPQRVQVLFYFLVESPLRPRDLLGVCQTLGARTVQRIGTLAAQRREERLYTDQEPRWR